MLQRNGAFESVELTRAHLAGPATVAVAAAPEEKLPGPSPANASADGHAKQASQAGNSSGEQSTHKVRLGPAGPTVEPYDAAKQATRSAVTAGTGGEADHSPSSQKPAREDKAAGVQQASAATGSLAGRAVPPRQPAVTKGKDTSADVGIALVRNVHDDLMVRSANRLIESVQHV